MPSNPPPSGSYTSLSNVTYIYYCPPSSNDTLSSTFQLLPAPMISLNMETNYSSQNSNIVVGYTYVIDFNGQVTAYDPYQDEGANLLQKTGAAIAKLRRILSTMGGILHIVDGNGTYLLKARGGTLRSLNINESPDHWTHTAQYTAQLEFNEVEFLGETINYCGITIPASGIINADSVSKEDIVDINKYKIKSFSENLTIDLGDDLYSSIRDISIASPLTVENSSFVVNYTVSANGKHHYIYPNSSDTQLLPAWEQAKNFCQYRLTQQVRKLVGNVLRVTSNSACNATITTPNFDSNSYGVGSMQTLDGNYKVYNETVDCTISESEGTCELNYKSIIKRISNIDISRRLGALNTNHKFNKTITKNNDANNSTTISINGTIEGLVDGALIYATNPEGTFDIPAVTSSTAGRVSLIIAGSNIQNKYNNAKLHLDNILNNNKDDFSDDIKPLLGITFEDLGLNGSYNGCALPEEPYPKAAVFNLTHNYHEGTITYNIEYNSSKSCGKKLANISINVEKPVEVFATFKIPNKLPGEIGTILQNIGTFTAPKINITVQGRDDINMYCCDNIANAFTFGTLCSNITLPPNFPLPPRDSDLYILTNKTKQTNIIDGSYTINLSYIIAR